MRFDKFYNYQELSEALDECAAAYPQLCRISSIGDSYEGRSIWLATITNRGTGPDEEKPALWVDANIHATELTGCTAALYLIHHLLSRYGSDKKVTRALDTRAFYVVPRLNPDGPELALAERPRFIRSSVRRYPLPYDPKGLVEEDIDGDGRVLMMRVPDPNGAWKAHPGEPRLLVRRDPDEAAEDGTFYRVLPEGRMRDYDGVTIELPEPPEALDLNRNYPMEWSTEGEQQGAGPYPTSEPEVRAMVQAIVDRPNITGHITYHTFSGVHLRPYSAHADEHFPSGDLRAYRLIGAEAERITGYKAVSCYHDFRYEPKEFIQGGADDWTYDHIGIFGWTTEFWSPQRAAGITDYHLIEWLRDHPVEDDLKLLKWSDGALEGRGYVDWYPFEHPQLGRVELGGWDFMYCWTNPPPHLLQEEITPHADFALWHLLISPRLEIHSLEHKTMGADLHWVRVAVVNTGWLPTNVTEKAVERKAVRPVEIELSLPDNARIASGEQRTELGQLQGRVHTRSLTWWHAGGATADRSKAEWVIEAPAGAELGIKASHPRAGTVRASLTLQGK